jgi:hypothetical protein
MQELEIKDVQSGAVYRIAPQGSVIGREGAKADIIIKNPSVSKRHARIFATDGQWFLEDLGSSNGTFFANQRISEPVPLGGGTLFALAEIQFEVVKKGGGDERGGGGRDRGERDRLRAATAARPDEGELLGASGHGGGGGGGSTARPSNNRSSPAGASAFASNDAGDEEVATGVGAIMSVIPRAFAHYVVAVPKLAFNPMGTVRASVEEQSFPTMSWWTLAGWGIPPMLLVGVVAVLVSIISMLVGGGFVASALVSVIITPAIQIAVALVMALIWHPVLNFVINLLKGHSDARSRSNYFVITMTAMALGGVVTGVSGLFALIPVPFITIVPVLLGVVASLISLYVSYVWVKYFEMHKVVQILVLIGLVATGLSGLWGVYGSVAGGASMVAGAGGTAGMPPEAAAALAEAQKAAEAATKAAEAATKAAGEAGGAAADLNKDVDQKVAAALAGDGKVTDPAAKAKADAAATEAGRAERMKAELEKQNAEDERARAEKAKADADAKAKADADAKAAKTDDAAAKAEAAATAKAEAAAAAAAKVDTAKADADVDDAPRGGSGYTAWAAKRDAVEKAIADDPLLLRRKDVLALYETYTRVAFDVRKNFNAKRSKNEPWRDRIIERQISAEIFDKTRTTIEDLHGKIF